MKPAMMMGRGFIVMFLLYGCATSMTSDPTFPVDAVPAVTSSSQFDKVTKGADGSKGQMIKLAGRIIDVSTTQEGALIIASWLPFPKQTSLEEGPPDSPATKGRHFVFLFPGTIRDPFIPGEAYDPKVAWEGNRFILEGKLAGKKTVVLDPLGDQKSLLHVQARCIHVWETGQSEVADQPDSQWAGTIGRTFCATK